MILCTIHNIVHRRNTQTRILATKLRNSGNAARLRAICHLVDHKRHRRELKLVWGPQIAKIYRKLIIWYINSNCPYYAEYLAILGLQILQNCFRCTLYSSKPEIIWIPWLDWPRFLGMGNFASLLLPRTTNIQPH